jgi:hypothetical protein
MDYLKDDDSVALSKPGAYDVEAINYLYQMTDQEPKTTFCTDDSVTSDPECAMFDHGKDPLTETWEKTYSKVMTLVFKMGWGSLYDMYFDYYVNYVLDFARGAGSDDVAVNAYNAAMAPAHAPIAPENIAKPGYAETADGLARRVLTRLYLDPEALRGYVSFDPSSPAVVAAALQDLSDNLTNVDNIRSFETRRVCVDILKKMQSNEAFAALRASRTTVATARAALSGEEAALTDDLLQRIDRALSPYFDH